MTHRLVLCALVALCAGTPMGQHPDAPTQIHINQGNADGTAITVSWMTQNITNGTVILGAWPEMYVYPNMEESRVTSYPAERYTFSAPTNQSREPYTSGLIHHHTIEGLEYSKTYYYRCGSPEGGFSEEFSFITPPRPGPDARVVFSVIGDLGQTNYSKKNMEDILADPEITSVVLVGDLSYADSAWEAWMPNQVCQQRRWDSFEEMVQPLAARKPLMTAAGNHEVEYDGAPLPFTQTPFLAYSKRHKMPSTDGRLYYSYNYGPVHIIMLNSYEDFNTTSSQYAFLEADLKAVDRSITPWLMVGLHAPFYNSNSHHHNEKEETGPKEFWEPLFMQYKVDVVFAGHVHNYERTHPVYQNATNVPGAPTYITIGDAGNREGPALGFYQLPEWTAFRDSNAATPERVFGHGRVEVVNSTHMHFGWRRLGDTVDDVSDEVWFIRNQDQGGVSARPYHAL